MKNMIYLSGLHKTGKMVSVTNREAYKNETCSKNAAGQTIISFTNSFGQVGGSFIAEEKAKIEKWASKEAYAYPEFIAPDGKTGSMAFFQKEARYGHLHDCIVQY